MLEALQGPLGTLLAALLGGLLAILGSITVLRANLRHQDLEKRADVYQQQLQFAHRMLQAASASAEINELANEVDELYDHVIKHVGESIAQGSGTQDPLRIRERAKELQFAVEEASIFIEPSDDIASDA